MLRLFRFLLLLAASSVAWIGGGCSSSSGPAQMEDGPELVGATTSQGHGYPYGSGDGQPFTSLTVVAIDPQYGFSVDNPIRVGGGGEAGPENSRMFLNALLGPGGEAVTYERSGSCCPFEAKNSQFGVGLLDVYILTVGGAEPKRVYLDIYNSEALLVPVGFTARK